MGGEEDYAEEPSQGDEYKGEGLGHHILARSRKMLSRLF